MCQMNKIVELHPFMDPSGTHGGTVDRGIGTDFHIIVNDHISHLRNLVVVSVSLGSEAKAIGTDHGTCMDDAALTHHRIAIKPDSRVQRGAISDYGAITDIHLGIDLHIIAYLDILA